MKNIRKQLHSVFLALLSMMLLTVTVLAATGSLRVKVTDENGNPVSGINVETIRVVTEAGLLTEDFSSLSLTAAELMADPGADHAETVYQYFCAKELSGTIKQTNTFGVVEFTGLENGLYLVLERGNQQVAFRPYLVMIQSNLVDSAPKTSETNTGTVWVSKIWEDNQNTAGNRPASIDVTLSHNGTAVRRVTLSAANLWQHTFTGVPGDGTYTVEESVVADYTAAYYPVLEGFIIVNTYTGGTPGPGPNPPIPVYASVSVRKDWNDENNAAGLRPGSVTMQLVEKNVVIRTAVLSEANAWQYTFGELDPTAAYTVQEIAVPGYLATYSGNAASGITVTNTLSGSPDTPEPPTPVQPTPETVNIAVEKLWDDAENAQEKRPGQVTIHLIADGSIVSTVRLEEKSDWKGEFRNVPRDLSYTVWEEPVTDYSALYSGSAAEGYKVTNVLTVGVTDPGIPLLPEPLPPENLDVPAKPQEPAIPQTGTETWPMYLLAALGLLFVAAGVLLQRKQVEP